MYNQGYILNKYLLHIDIVECIDYYDDDEFQCHQHCLEQPTLAFQHSCYKQSNFLSHKFILCTFRGFTLSSNKQWGYTPS
jgi:hypothetical protein